MPAKFKVHYENTPMQYTEMFWVVKNLKFDKNFSLYIFLFFFFAQNIDCGYALEPPRRGGSNNTHNLCFGAKIRKISIPLHTPVLLYKSGVLEGTHFTDMLS